MGPMRDRLYSAWVRVLLFWWIASTVGWAFSNDAIRGAATRLGLILPGTPVTALNAAWAAWRVLVRWSAPALMIAAAAAAIGAAGVFALYAIRNRNPNRPIPGGKPSPRRSLLRRGNRAQETSCWRGIEVTIGALPRPDWQPGPFPMLELEGLDAYDLPAPHRRLLHEVISWVAAQKGAYVGPGHTEGRRPGEGLLEHTLHVVNRAAAAASGGKAAPDRVGLLLIGAAAHDAGKALVWRRTAAGDWKRSGWHDEAGARLLSQTPSFTDLPESDRRILSILIGYEHKPSLAPRLEGPERARLEWLRAALAGADREATREEKKALFETGRFAKTGGEGGRDQILLNAFFQALRAVHFQVPGIKPGLRASAWRTGNRLYLLEPGLRTQVLKALPEDLAAAYGGDYRPKGGVAPVTRDLLGLLEQKGWVVGEHDGVRAKPPLWRFRSGSKDFSGVIALDLPADRLTGLPGDTHFPVQLLDPVFPPAAGAHSDRQGQSRPSPAAPSPGPPEGGSAGSAEVAEGTKPQAASPGANFPAGTPAPGGARRPARARRPAGARTAQEDLGELSARTGLSIEELSRRLRGDSRKEPDRAQPTARDRQESGGQTDEAKIIPFPAHPSQRED